MVYNAMKLFMEVNPSLFDDCSHEYAEHQNNADERQQSRQDRWERLTQQAKARQSKQLDAASAPPGAEADVSSVPPTSTEALGQESERRMEALKI